MMRCGTMAVLVGAVAFVGSLVGCKEQGKEEKVREVAGTVEKIDLKNRVVTVSTYVEQLNTEQSFPVRVTEETEVLINGQLARLEDVQVGERAVGSIRIEKEGEQKKYTAMQVRIERAQAIVVPGAAADDTGTNATNAEDIEDAGP